MYTDIFRDISDERSENYVLRRQRRAHGIIYWKITRNNDARAYKIIQFRENFRRLVLILYLQ